MTEEEIRRLEREDAAGALKLAGIVAAIGALGVARHSVATMFIAAVLICILVIVHIVHGEDDEEGNG